MFISPSLMLINTYKPNIVEIPEVYNAKRVSENKDYKISIDPTIYAYEDVNKQTLASINSISIVVTFDHVLKSYEIHQLEQQGIKFERVMGKIVHFDKMYVARISDTSVLRVLSSYNAIRVASGENKKIPTIDSSVKSIGAQDTWQYLKDANGNKITGKGQTIAVIDTGITWQHPTFWKPGENSYNILENNSKYYVDLNNNHIIDNNEGPIAWIDNDGNSNSVNLKYEYMFIDANNNGVCDLAQGERWLVGNDENENGYMDFNNETVKVLTTCKIKAIWDQYENKFYIRGVNLTSIANTETDDIGHGTHVASTIAGGQINYTKYVGIAPDADIIMIKSDLTTSKIIEGMYYAILNDARVINMSFCGFWGFLDGTDPEDQAISLAFLLNNTISVVATGNLRTYSKHGMTTVDDQASLSFSVGSSSVVGAIVFLTRGNGTYTVTLKDPDGNTYQVGDLGLEQDISEINEDSIRTYLISDFSYRKTSTFTIALINSNHYIKRGTWEVIFTADNNTKSPQVIHAYAWDFTWSGTGLRMASGISNDYTVGAPATADQAIAVSAYSDYSGNFFSASGVGPRIDGLQKPEISAPGEYITAASNTVGKWSTKSGTSMATPHITGVVALLRQASQYNSSMEIRQYLLNYTTRDAHTGNVPNNLWGYGKVNVFKSSAFLRDFNMKSLKPDEWRGLDPQISSDDLIAPQDIDIKQVYVYHNRTHMIWRVDTYANINLTSTSSDIFRIYIDTDFNNHTGSAKGYSYQIAINSTNAYLYQWDSDWILKQGTIKYNVVNNSLIVSILQSDISIHNKMDYEITTYDGYFGDSTGRVYYNSPWIPIAYSATLVINSENNIVNVSFYDRDSSYPEIIATALWTCTASTHEWTQTIQPNSNTFSFELSPIDTDLFTILLHIKIIDQDKGIGELPVIAARYLFPVSLQISARINESVIFIPIFGTGKVTGNVNISDPTMVNEVYLCFNHGDKWENTTIEIGKSVNFEISVTTWQDGNYTVYVSVETKNSDYISLKIGTIEIIHESPIRIISLFGAVIIGAYLIISYVRNRTKKVDQVPDTLR